MFSKLRCFGEKTSFTTKDKKNHYMVWEIRKINRNYIKPQCGGRNIISKKLSLYVDITLYIRDNRNNK